MDEQNGSEKPNVSTVGYCNPPEYSRFRPGRSGNPNGRPRGTFNLATVLLRALREKVFINVDSRKKSVTKLDAIFKKLLDKAATGDLNAIKLVAMLVRSAEERGIQTAAANSSSGETNISFVNVNLDEKLGRRLAETYLGRHGGRLETRSSE
jgi:hypothetical protein